MIVMSLMPFKEGPMNEDDQMEGEYSAYLTLDKQHSTSENDQLILITLCHLKQPQNTAGDVTYKF